jgi:hypothetical protein
MTAAIATTQRLAEEASLKNSTNIMQLVFVTLWSGFDIAR